MCTEAVSAAPAATQRAVSGMAAAGHLAWLNIHRMRCSQAFFAEIYMEAVAAAPAAAHRAIAGMAAAGVLQRHYTLNIDGLGEAVGMDTWHPDTNPEGQIHLPN